MKKVALSGFVLASFAFYAFFTKHEETESRNAISVVQNSVQSSAIPQETSTPKPNSQGKNGRPFQTVAPTPQGKFKDGVYTGSRADAFYGYMQVKVTVSGGRITDVVFLEYPSDRGTSVEINSQAMPYLKQEAIAAQDSNVNIVTGATDSSYAFRESLKTALSQAI